MKKLLLFVLAISFISTSCKKYSEGGLVSRADKRLSEHAWKLNKYLRNGNDETSLLIISNFTDKFDLNGAFTRSYNDSNGDLSSEFGIWVFDTNKMQIKLTGVGSLDLTNQTGTVSSSDYNIIRLKKHELWYYYENGGSRHEFHMIK